MQKFKISASFISDIKKSFPGFQSNLTNLQTEICKSDKPKKHRKEKSSNDSIF